MGRCTGRKFLRSIKSSYMPKNVVLYTLQTFSTTGGIQKMTRTLAHALNTLAQNNNWEFKLKSLYDTNDDLMLKYIPIEKFRGFNLNRTGFILNAVFSARKPTVVIISHINLALIGLLIKLINPRCKVWLIAHGIEVWRPLSPLKKAFLRRCDKIICVSNFNK